MSDPVGYDGRYIGAHFDDERRADRQLAAQNARENALKAENQALCELFEKIPGFQTGEPPAWQEIVKACSKLNVNDPYVQTILRTNIKLGAYYEAFDFLSKNQAQVNFGANGTAYIIVVRPSKGSITSGTFGKKFMDTLNDIREQVEGKRETPKQAPGSAEAGDGSERLDPHAFDQPRY